MYLVEFEFWQHCSDLFPMVNDWLLFRGCYAVLIVIRTLEWIAAAHGIAKSTRVDRVTGIGVRVGKTSTDSLSMKCSALKYLRGIKKDPNIPSKKHTPEEIVARPIFQFRFVCRPAVAFPAHNTGGGGFVARN